MVRRAQLHTEDDHAQAGNVLADIDTITLQQDKAPNLANKWMAAFDEHYGVDYPFCIPTDKTP